MTGPVHAWGMVIDEGRGSLPFALVHGESLIAAAAFSLEAAEVTLIDPRTDLAILREEQCLLVLHDPLCPLTPPDFLADVVERCDASGAIVVGYRPTSSDSDPVEVTSPIVLPATVVDQLEELPHGDFADLVADYRARFPVIMVEAPPAGRRVHGAEDLAAIEALDSDLETITDGVGRA